MNEAVAGHAVDRVREHTDLGVLTELDQQTAERLRQLAAEGPVAISARLRALDKESDIERILEINASVIALFGLVAGALRRRWLPVPVLVLGFLLQHAIQGWCPPMAVLRRLGVRTRAEIDAERYALKYLRGDFRSSAQAGSSTPTSSPADGDDPAARALAAVRR